MEEGDLKTSPRKDVTYVEADETTLPNGFDDPLLLGSFKFAGKATSISLNDALTAFRPQQLFHQQEMQKTFFKFSVNSPDAEKSLCIVINYLDTSLNFPCVHLKQNLLWKNIGI